MTTHPANQPPLVDPAEKERRRKAWEASLDAEDAVLRDRTERLQRAREELGDDERAAEAVRVFGGRR